MSLDRKHWSRREEAWQGARVLPNRAELLSASSEVRTSTCIHQPAAQILLARLAFASKLWKEKA